MRKEWVARSIVIVVLLAALALPAWKLLERPGWNEVHARMPEAGGWGPSQLTVPAGEPLRLRLTSDDVVHSFAIGHSDRPPVDILPGEVTELELTFDEPGTYTYYCTRWCGENHWRMRGTIVVTGNEPPAEDVAEAPLYMQLGIDLDAPAPHTNLDLPWPPSAERGAVFAEGFPLKQFSDYLTMDYYRAHSPAQAWNDLRAVPATGELTNTQLWDVVAWIWQLNLDPQRIAEGEALYRQDCAACHGSTGSGDGVFAQTAGSGEHTGAGYDGHSQQAPPDFRDPDYMTGLSPAHLQGKIIRGGMGTGMPAWGLIYTDEQTWSLVGYIESLLFAPTQSD